MAFAISTVIGVAGLATAGFGLYENISGNEKAASANAAAAQNQAQIAALQAGNVDTQKQQLNLQTQQQQLQIQTQTNVIQDQAQADTIRQQAAELDATRQKREAIRNGIVARSQSLVAATNQGGSAPGSTALKQSNASISGQTDTNLLGITQNLGVGNQLYNINKDITSQYLNAQNENSAYVNTSQQLQSKVLDTQKQIYTLGGSASSDYASAALAQGNAAFGTGLLTAGTAIANNYKTIDKLTNYFGSSGSAASGNNYGYTAQNYGNGTT